MSSFIPLEEAAKRLGVTIDELIEMRSRGEIFGYRDGGSWKFKPEEIERVLEERQAEEAGESSLTLGPEEGGSSAHSDVALVADSGADSDVRLVPSGEETLPRDEDDEEELSLMSEEDKEVLDAVKEATTGSDSEVTLEAKGGEGSDVPLGSDALDLQLSESSNVLSGSDVSLGSDADIVKGDTDKTPGSSGLELEGSDLQLDDDLDLADDSDVALGSDSGINLMSPSDSGISLEDEPLDLAASGISGLDLAGEGSDVDVKGGGSDSAVDFTEDEEFQLSPSGAIEVDEEDSDSQVIELEDSTEFGEEAVAVDDSGLGAISDVDGGGLESEPELAPTAAAIPTPAAYSYGLVEVLGLLVILLLMGLSGILVSDIARNMWAWSGGEDSLTSAFGQAISSIINK